MFVYVVLQFTDEHGGECNTGYKKMREPVDEGLVSPSSEQRAKKQKLTA